MNEKKEVLKCESCGKFFNPEKTDVCCHIYCSRKCCDHEWFNQCYDIEVLYNEYPECPCY